MFPSEPTESEAPDMGGGGDYLRQALEHCGVDGGKLSSLVSALESWKSGDDSKLEALCQDEKTEEAPAGPPPFRDAQRGALEKRMGKGKSNPFGG